jgi:hypothetical protein
MSEINQLIALVRHFRDERDWAQYHNAKFWRPTGSDQAEVKKTGGDCKRAIPCDWGRAGQLGLGLSWGRGEDSAWGLVGLSMGILTQLSPLFLVGISD